MSDRLVLCDHVCVGWSRYYNAVVRRLLITSALPTAGSTLTIPTASLINF
jgi:hypothetical protein